MEIAASIRATACSAGPTCSCRTSKASGSIRRTRPPRKSPRSRTTVRPARSSTGASTAARRKRRRRSTRCACSRTGRMFSTPSLRSMATRTSAIAVCCAAAAPRKPSRSATRAITNRDFKATGEANKGDMADARGARRPARITRDEGRAAQGRRLARDRLGHRHDARQDVEDVPLPLRPFVEQAVLRRHAFENRLQVVTSDHAPRARQCRPDFSLSRRVSALVSTRSSLLRRICASSESAAAASSPRSFW